MSGVAVVTGAAGGIGSATVRQLTADGMTVVALDLDADAASAVSPQSYALDVSNADAVDDVMGRILAQFGRIDVLVNNAGITGSQEATTAHATPVDEFGDGGECARALPLFTSSSAIHDGGGQWPHHHDRLGSSDRRVPCAVCLYNVEGRGSAARTVDCR